MKKDGIQTRKRKKNSTSQPNASGSTDSKNKSHKLRKTKPSSPTGVQNTTQLTNQMYSNSIIPMGQTNFFNQNEEYQSGSYENNVMIPAVLINPINMPSSEINQNYTISHYGEHLKTDQCNINDSIFLTKHQSIGISNHLENASQMINEPIHENMKIENGSFYRSQRIEKSEPNENKFDPTSLLKTEKSEPEVGSIGEHKSSLDCIFEPKNAINDIIKNDIKNEEVHCKSPVLKENIYGEVSTNLAGQDSFSNLKTSVSDSELADHKNENYPVYKKFKMTESQYANGRVSESSDSFLRNDKSASPDDSNGKQKSD